MVDFFAAFDLSPIEDFLAENALVLTCAAIGISGLITALAALISAARSRNRAAQVEFAELKGRMSAMAELSVQQTAEQARSFNERLDMLARNVSQTLESTTTLTARQNAEQVRNLNERMDMLARSVSQALDSTTTLSVQQTSEQARGLNERIDTLARHVSQALEATATRLGENLNATAARLGDNMSESERRTWESLSTLNERLALIDEANRNLAELSSEVGSLHGVLANKQARGAFGQMRMETIVRDALPSGAYEFQPTLSNGKRPDCVVRLPNTEALVVDSKFPLEGFEALRVANTAEETKLACAAIREAVGRHVAAIAEKYLIPGETQETALMFVPSESICADLYEKFPDLVQAAHRARVMIVSPNTFMLAVQTVQALLKDAKMRDHADIIQREVGLLVGDVAQLVERVADLERHFALSGKALEKVKASTTKILSRRERLNALDLDAMQDAASNVMALPDAEQATKRTRSS